MLKQVDHCGLEILEMLEVKKLKYLILLFIKWLMMK